MNKPPVIDEDGFLRGLIDDWVIEQRKLHCSAVTDAEALNRMGHRFLSERKVDLGDLRQKVVVILFARMMELYQSVLLLTYRGMKSASSVQFRALVEAYFHFEAIRQDPSYLDEFLEQVHVDRVRLASGIARSDTDELAGLRAYFTSERVESAKQDKDAVGAKTISVKDVAERGGNEAIYRTAYAILSGDVHTSAYSLESHLRWDEDGNDIIGFRYGPEEYDEARNLGLSIIMLVEALEEVCRVFGETEQAEAKAIKKRQLDRFKDQAG